MAGVPWLDASYQLRRGSRWAPLLVAIADMIMRQLGLATGVLTSNRKGAGYQLWRGSRWVPLLGAIGRHCWLPLLECRHAGFLLGAIARSSNGIQQWRPASNGAQQWIAASCSLLAVAKNPATVAKKPPGTVAKKPQHRPSQKKNQPTHRRKKNRYRRKKPEAPQIYAQNLCCLIKQSQSYAV